MKNPRRLGHWKPSFETLDERVVFSNLPVVEPAPLESATLVDAGFTPGGYCTAADAANEAASHIEYDGIRYDRQAWGKLGNLAEVAVLLEMKESQNVYTPTGRGSLLEAAGIYEDFYYIEQGRVFVTAVANLEFIDQLPSALAEHNVEVTGHYNNVVEGWVALEDLKSLKDVPELNFLNAAMRPLNNAAGIVT